MRCIDVRCQLIDLFSGHHAVQKNRSGAGAADGAVAHKFHAPMMTDPRIVRRHFDGETRRRIVTRPGLNTIKQFRNRNLKKKMKLRREFLRPAVDKFPKTFGRHSGHG